MSVGIGINRYRHCGFEMLLLLFVMPCMLPDMVGDIGMLWYIG
jgi:ABC-type spermidine/putrescine transport system permease subunit II